LSPGTGKQDCHIIDFVDSMKRVIGVVSVPTLLGLDPTIVVDGTTHSLIWLSEMLMPSSSKGTITELELRADAATGDSSVTPIGDNRCSIPDPCSVTYIDYDDPFSLVNQTLGTSPHIAKLSRNAWVGCGDDIYVLECLGKGHIQIELVPGGERDLRKESPFIFFSFPQTKRDISTHIIPQQSTPKQPPL
jgi:ATP-dependent helicase IRC3